MDTRILASGRIAVLDDSGRVIDILTELVEDYDWEPTCGICDATGHGYPGAGPCPLEDVDYSGEPWWAL